MGRANDMGAVRLLGIMAVVCLAAVGLALLAQHRFDMRPCPWCVLQRGIYLLMAAVFGIAAALGGKRMARLIPVILGLLLAGAGAASALYQHQVAAQQFSCSRTLADKIISALQLDEALPAVFSATASCADAAVSLLGIPFAYWSLGLFVALGLGSGWVLLRERGR